MCNVSVHVRIKHTSGFIFSLIILLFPPHPPPLACLSSYVPTDPPVVTLSPVPSTQHGNTPLSLSCGFDANPTPNITWLFNRTGLVINPPRLSVNTTGSVSVLQFSSLEGRDTGEYSCIADNGIGSPATSGNALIIVLGESPSDSIILCSAVVRGHTALTECCCLECYISVSIGIISQIGID